VVGLVRCGTEGVVVGGGGMRKLGYGEVRESWELLAANPMLLRVRTGMRASLCSVSILHCAIEQDGRENRVYSSDYIITFSGYHQRAKSDDTPKCPVRSRESIQIRGRNSKENPTTPLPSSHLICISPAEYSL
jgi:hypothetical protein